MLYYRVKTKLLSTLSSVLQYRLTRTTIPVHAYNGNCVNTKNIIRRGPIWTLSKRDMRRETSERCTVLCSPRRSGDPASLPFQFGEVSTVKPKKAVGHKSTRQPSADATTGATRLTHRACNLNMITKRFSWGWVTPLRNDDDMST